MRSYQVDLYFRGPLLFKAVGTLALGIDAAMQTYQGRPVLMGSALRGNVRHALQELLPFVDQRQQSEVLFDRWFGSASLGEAPNGGGGYGPVRRQVHFDFVWELVSPVVTSSGTRTRILIDDKGTVVNGALQTIEDMFAFGASEEPHFRGMIKVDPAVEKDFGFWLERALCMIPAIGSNKSIGFGQLADFSVSEKPANKKLAAETLPVSVSDSFGFSFTLDRPLCLGIPRTDDSNLIVSDEVITGNVIKAVIARQFIDDDGKPDTTTLENLCFDQIRISHCLPAPAESLQRLPPMPRSVAFLPGGEHGPDRIVCAAGMDPAMPWPALPAFQADRKPVQSRACEHALKLPRWEQQRLVLVRTQIEPATGTAQEAALFSTECVEPLTRVHTDQGVTESVTRWCGNVDLRDVPAERRPFVQEALAKVFAQGLQSIGKTGACTVELQLHAKPFTPPAQAPVQVGELAVVTLLSDSRLFVPGWERTTQFDANAHYKQYWDSVSEKHLRLQRFFATQRLRGGVYHHWRFQRGRPYAPEWLTTAGSVFVLEVVDDIGRQKLELWRERGLPTAPDTDGLMPDWRSCPYLPEHGFGEILVNWKALSALSDGLASDYG